MYSLVYKIKHLRVEAPSSKSIRSFSEQVTRVLRFPSLGLSSGIWQNVPGLREALLIYLPASRRVGSFRSSAKLSVLQSAPVGVSGTALGSDGLGPGPGPSSPSSTSVSQRGPRAPVHLDLGRIPGAGVRPAQGPAPGECPPESGKGERFLVQEHFPSLGERCHFSKISTVCPSGWQSGHPATPLELGEQG